ncbi:MAG TPA: PDZ domain-containing protein, partial [Alphaproteobacteria bacterium]|nr:PDZ domain-containing protein [Alphaproteobacteria bacterium]
VDMRHLPRIVAETPINSTVPMVVWRENKDVRLNVKIGEMKDTDEAKAAPDDNEDTKQNSTLASRSTQIPELDIKVSAINPQARQQYQLKDDTHGLVITSIGDSSSLADKGVQAGDVIVEAGQKDVKDPRDLQKLAKDAASAKKPLLLLIDRQGDLRFVAAGTGEPKPEKKEEKKDEKKK